MIRGNDDTRLVSLRRRVDPLPVDDAVSDHYARLAARVISIGCEPRGRSFDLLIAATARAHGAVLYTRNPAGLTGLEDLVDIATI